MDKKVSIRLREKEYEKIAERAMNERKSVSEYIRGRVLTETGQEGTNIKGNERVKIQMLEIKRYIDSLSASCPNINFQPVEDAMGVIWDELY